MTLCKCVKFSGEFLENAWFDGGLGELTSHKYVKLSANLLVANGSASRSREFSTEKKRARVNNNCNGIFCMGPAGGIRNMRNVVISIYGLLIA